MNKVPFFNIIVLNLQNLKRKMLQLNYKLINICYIKQIYFMVATMIDNIMGKVIRSVTKCSLVTVQLDTHYLVAISEGTIY